MGQSTCGETGLKGTTKNLGAIRQPAVLPQPPCHWPSVLGITARTSP